MKVSAKKKIIFMLYLKKVYAIFRPFTVTIH